MNNKYLLKEFDEGLPDKIKEALSNTFIYKIENKFMTLKENPSKALKKFLKDLNSNRYSID